MAAGQKGDRRILGTMRPSVVGMMLIEAMSVAKGAENPAQRKPSKTIASCPRGTMRFNDDGQDAGGNK